MTALTEAQFQEQVIELAHLAGWEHMHVRRSIGKGNRWVTATNVTGYPDLTLWSPRHRRVMFVELKSETGKATPEQVAVLASLASAGLETHLWRPSDWPQIQAALTARGEPTDG